MTIPRSKRKAIFLTLLSLLFDPGTARGSLHQVIGRGVERLFVSNKENEVDCDSSLLKYLKEQAQQLPNGYSDYEDMHDKEYNIPELIKDFKVHVDNSANEKFGPDGRFTHEVEERFKRSQDFWMKAGVDTSNIVVKGMHGEDFSRSSSNLEDTLSHLNSGGGSVASRAEEIRTFIESLPDKYGNPLLTFKSKVHKAENSWDPDIILIGDGALEFQLSYCNLGDKSAEFEFAFMFAKLLVEREGLPELSPDESNTRRHMRWELMETVLGAYFLAHEYGGGFEGTDCCILHHTAYAWGDCNEASGVETGHGDPEQRECAAIYGVNLATRPHLKHAILDPKMIQVLFDNYFEDILAKDPSMCYHDPNHNMEPKVMPCTQSSCPMI
eukprot:CAMPEP_0197438646 /NCGR_PEP_ID=MMETSP1175-20131217/5567_1 /TAXON_ID=1003142 /ORGANISM="Triceratium dubium, Strain CCMP147" /LENGTH=382 /DNA_ID=CAMNT_0042968411 /DNA_START=35 /DNA_END=1183 /DNA_ORIENTATION=+